MEVKVTIGGDFCITRENMNKSLFSNELTELFINSDLNIVNLECPIVVNNLEKKIVKTGPNLSTSKDIFKHLKKINIHALTLANNHILDYGKEGLENTINGCKESKISYVGAGLNLSDASEPIIIKKNGIRIGLVNFCENEWTIASDDDAGANPIDLIDNIKQIKLARELADFVLVIIHGGHEYYNLPSPRMIKQYRFFAENGADAIIGHHTHCMGGYEIHDDVPIFYSLGNMLFTLPSQHESWYSGLLVELKLIKGKPISWIFHPIQQSKEDYLVTLKKGIEMDKTLNEIDGYSRIIKDESAIKVHWFSFIKRQQKTINIFSPINIIPNRYLRWMLKRIGIDDFLLKRQNLPQILNHIRCEAHKDLIVELFKIKIYNK